MLSQQPLGVGLANLLEVRTLQNWSNLVKRLTVFEQQLRHWAVLAGLVGLERSTTMTQTQVTMLALQVFLDPD
jgi:hypothetical protein